MAEFDESADAKRREDPLLDEAERTGSPDTERPSGEESTKPVKGMTTLAYILLILLVILAIVFCWLWWWKNKVPSAPPGPASTSTTTTTPATEAACADELTHYSNEDLDIQFCYPETWGEVSVADARLQTTPSSGVAADTGSRWRLSFSTKPAVNLGLVSNDWTTEVGRDGTCVDPARTTLPAFSPFSTAWNVVDTGGSSYSANRGIAMVADQYLIQEYTDDLLTNGVCMEGFKMVSGLYPHVVASYSADFNATVTGPSQHVANPNALVSTGDRSAFNDFVESIQKI